MRNPNRFDKDGNVIDSTGEIVNIGDRIAFNSFGMVGYDMTGSMVIESFTPKGSPKGNSGAVQGAFFKTFKQ